MSDESDHRAIRTSDWIYPLLFFACAAWLMWHTPAFILDIAPPADQSGIDRLAAQHRANDVTPDMGGPFGGYADFIDYLAVIGGVVFFILGVLTVRRAPMEFESWTRADRPSVFIGRVAMVMVAVLTAVMIYEVILRYVFERPTMWANELSLWLAGFVFLLAGLYAMQQRSHIRIFILYDAMPRLVQRIFDTISTLLIVAFAFFLIYGGLKEASDKFFRWETFGTAFDPPLPATLKMAVLFVVTLVAIQAIINLITDWNAEPVVHTAADDIDADELERLRRAVGAEGTGARDVTRGSIQGKETR